MNIARENVKRIYEHLADEESKDIFCNRLMLSLTEDWKFARNIVGKYLNGYSSDKIFIGMEDSIAMLGLNTQDEYVIYGAGMFGRQVFDILKKRGIKVKAFGDADRRKQKEGYCGLVVLSPEEIAELTQVKVLLAVWNQSENIKSNLLKLNVEETRIIDCFPIKNYVDKNQYFDEGIIKLGENEVFLDCGCYDFETSQIFMEKCPTYNKVICFEPNKDNQKLIEQKIKQFGENKVEMIPYGVWNKRDTLYFGGSGSSAMVSESGIEKVEVVTIDEVIKDKVTFVKMDIEGSELNALKGAARTIINNKPRLAICVYHKPEDILEIPLYILNLIPEYKLYLRHYSNYFATETVLYAVI